jgi:FlaA1/EpsC-like NDP-sugar epimerase
MPTVFELLQDSGGRLQVTRQLRQVQLEDMLGRESVTMDLERVGRYLAGRVVMVTGAGGSIGSELCRQIARVAPSKLVLVDHAEDNLFEITRELQDERHVQIAVPVLGDCKEDERMREVLSEHRPTIVFHAAAYKHVAMMEQNPIEAIRNNSLATRLMARLAGELGRVGGRGGGCPFPGDQLCDRSLRQRAGFLRVGGSDLPSADRGGRPGHRYR